MSHKPIICLDFDGVLHSYDSGWKGADVIPDPPVEGAVDWCWITRKYYRLAVFSTRSADPKGIAAMKEWCEKHSFPKDLEFPVTKPPATLTIDDRGFCFRGKFPDLKFIQDFKPWNK